MLTHPARLQIEFEKGRPTKVTNITDVKTRAHMFVYVCVCIVVCVVRVCVC